MSLPPEVIAEGQRRGLLDAQGRPTQYGELNRNLVRVPRKARARTEQAWRDGLINADLSPTDDGRVLLDGREAAVRDRDRWDRWKLLGGEASWQEKNERPFMQKVEDAGVALVGMLGDAAAGAAGTISKQLKRKAGAMKPQEYAEEVVKLSNVAKGAARTQAAVATGAELALRKHIAPGAFTDEQRADAEFRHLNTQAQLEDLEDGQAAGAVAALVGAPVEVVGEVQRNVQAISDALPEGARREAQRQGQALGEFADPSIPVTGAASVGLRLIPRRLTHLASREAALRSQLSLLDSAERAGKAGVAASTRERLAKELDSVSRKLGELERRGGAVTQLRDVVRDVGRAAGKTRAAGAVAGAGKTADRALSWVSSKLTSGPLAVLGGVLGGGQGALTGAVVGKVRLYPQIRTLARDAAMIGGEALKRRQTKGYWQRVGEAAQNPLVRSGAVASDFVGKLARPATGAAKAAGRGLIAEAPLEYLASGGEDWLAGALVESLAFGAPGIVRGAIYGAGGMPAAARREYFRELAVGDEFEFRRSLPDDQRARFDRLPPEARRQLGVYSAVHPGMVVEFIDDPGISSSHNPLTGVVTVNVATKAPLVPLISHEVSHYLHDQGLRDTVVAQLVGERGALRANDGELTPDAQAFKRAYEKQFGVPISDERMALEWAAYATAPGLQEVAALQKLVRRNSLARMIISGLVDRSQLFERFMLRSGVLFDRDGNPRPGVGPDGKPLKLPPELARIIEDHIREGAGASQDAGARPVAVRAAVDPVKDPASPHVERMGSRYVIEDGKVKRDRLGRPVEIPPETRKHRETAGKTIVEAYAAERGYKPASETRAGTRYAFTPEDYRALARRIADSGVYNEWQNEFMANAAETIASGDGVPYLVEYTPLKKGGLERRTQAGIPFDVYVTKKGLIQIKAVDPDKLFNNARKFSKTEDGKRLYGGDLNRILDDLYQYARNQAAGVPNQSAFPGRASYLNALFGNSGAGHGDANPQLGNYRPTIISFRLDTVDQATRARQGELPFRWEAVVANLLPE